MSWASSASRQNLEGWFQGTGELDYLAEIKDRNASLVSFLLMFERINRDLPIERKQQTIVYCNGRSKAIENALAFADQFSDIQDNDLMHWRKI